MATPPEPGVHITMREIYDQIIGVREDMQRISLTSEETMRTLADHEARIRAIERWKYGVIVALISALSTTVTAVLGKVGVL